MRILIHRDNLLTPNSDEALRETRRLQAAILNEREVFKNLLGRN
jgi:hypothetical protein